MAESVGCSVAFQMAGVESLRGLTLRKAGRARRTIDRAEEGRDNSSRLISKC